MKDEGEVAVEGVGDVGIGQLTRCRRRGEQEGFPALRAVGLCDPIGRRVSNQLLQRDISLHCRETRCKVRKLVPFSSNMLVINKSFLFIVINKNQKYILKTKFQINPSK